MIPLLAALSGILSAPAGEAYRPSEVTVVDGDTLKIDGVNVRISNLDTPERGGRSECDAERMLAAVATKRAEAFVSSMTILVYPEGREDRYRRPLVRVTADGMDWGDLMVASDLAVPWAGRTHDWCAPSR